MIDFVKRDTQFIKQYDSVQAAWAALPEEERAVVVALRPLISSANRHIPNDADFPHKWLQELVSNKYQALCWESDLDDFESKHQVEFATQAEQQIRQIIDTIDPTPLWELMEEEVGEFDPDTIEEYV